MTQDTFTEKLSLWLDNELSPAEVTELKAHLVQCPACRQAYGAMQQIDGFLQTAATLMVMPAPGFVDRVEARLAQHQRRKPWQLWLAMTALLGGTVFVFGVWALFGGLTLIGILNASVIDGSVLYQGINTVIESIASLRLLFNFGALLLKACFVTLQQPVFWGGALVTLALTGLWVRIILALSGRTTSTVRLIL